MVENSKEVAAKTTSRFPPVQVFFSYAHEDENFRIDLEKHLSLMRRNGEITGWHDRNISAGAHWKDSIDQHLESAQIILLLISADFLASDYCYEIEMKRAMQRHRQGKARVIPIILRNCDWSSSPFSSLQALPKNAKPIKSWNDPDEAYQDVVTGIRKAAAQLTGATLGEPLPDNSAEVGLLKKRRVLSVVLGLMLLLLVVGAYLWKVQVVPPETATITGVVVDYSEKPIQEAKVSIDELPGMKPVETSSDGVFTITDIPRKYGDSVRIRVVKEGYVPNPYLEDCVLGKNPPRVLLRRGK
jgi:hypothetical protein